VTVPAITRDWVTGLAVVRRCPPPVEVFYGLRVDVGRPRERTRHILLRVDEDSVRTVGRATEPYTRMKAFLPAQRLRAWLGPQWEPDGIEYLMTTALRPSAMPVPEGYAVTSAVDDGVTTVRMLTADGQVAAAGYVGVTDGIAVFDRIETDTDHRRRGLGTAVMRALTAAALHEGAREAVLGATDDGRALYERLGWTVRATMAGFVVAATVTG
jgi:GNAT superfamily N-acetyltransferase